MQPGEKISEWLATRGGDDKDAASFLGISPSRLSQYKSGKRKKIDPLTCLCFAATISKSDEDREYWIELAGISLKQQEFVLHALGAKPMLSKEQKAVLDFWKHPGRAGMEELVHRSLSEIISNRLHGARRGNG